MESARTDEPAFRGAPSSVGFEQVAGLEIIRPPDGGTVRPDSLVFVWRAQSADTFYRLTLTDEAGDVLWRTSTSDTIVTPGADVTFRPGGEYFWIVDALLAGGRTATTGVRTFQIGDAR